MRRKVRAFPFQLKEADDAGHFSGYLSVFNVIDTYNERVMPGAFEQTLKDWAIKDALPPVLWQHDYRQPIGPHTLMREDPKGLYVEGQLLVDDVPQAKTARALMKAKAVTGMSIGFNTVVDQYNRETQLTDLLQVDLWEGSIVTFPANDAAQIDSIKSLMNGGGLPTIKEFEELLRDVGFSRTQAKTVVGHGLVQLLRDVESEKTAIDAKSIVDEIFKRAPITIEDILT